MYGRIVSGPPEAPWPSQTFAKGCPDRAPLTRRSIGDAAAHRLGHLDLAEAVLG